jgi:hypothetical protein
MRIFRITFINQDKVYLLHAESVRQGELYGFVEISGLLFDEHTTVVIDPAEEKLKAEFTGVARLQVPMHAVVRIDEVDRRGQNKILELDNKGNVTAFPAPVYTPKPGND